MNKKMTLLEIIEKFQLNKDKKSGTDKVRRHSYLPIYEEIFQNIKHKKLTILEIGTEYGGSGLLWHKYFENSKLILLDIKDRTLRKHMVHYNKRKYEKIISDAYKPDIVTKIKRKYPRGIDIAIDDGPHTLESQKEFIKLYLPLINKNGILAIEDIKSIEDAELLKSILPDQLKDKCVIHDLRHILNRFDDIMLVVNL